MTRLEALRALLKKIEEEESTHPIPVGHTPTHNKMVTQLRLAKTGLAYVLASGSIADSGISGL